MRHLVEALKEEISQDDVKMARRLAASLFADEGILRQMKDPGFNRAIAAMMGGLQELGLAADAYRLEDTLNQIDILDEKHRKAIRPLAKTVQAIAQKFSTKSEVWR